MSRPDDDLIVCKALPEDAAAFSGALRDADRQEVYAATGTDRYLRLLTASIASSQAAFSVWTHDMVPVALFGASYRNALTDHGTLWLVATDELARHWREFCRRTREYLYELVKSPAIMTNWIDARNDKALRYIRWLGAEVAPAQPFGPFGLPFHRFELRI